MVKNVRFRFSDWNINILIADVVFINSDLFYQNKSI